MDRTRIIDGQDAEDVDGDGECVVLLEFEHAYVAVFEKVVE